MRTERVKKLWEEARAERNGDLNRLDYFAALVERDTRHACAAAAASSVYALGEGQTALASRVQNACMNAKVGDE